MVKETYYYTAGNSEDGLMAVEDIKMGDPIPERRYGIRDHAVHDARFKDIMLKGKYCNLTYMKSDRW